MLSISQLIHRVYTLNRKIIQLLWRLDLMETLSLWFLSEYISLLMILFCVKEYSSDVGDPYYPVPNPRNQELYSKYQKLATEEEGVTFVGRLASYKYFNMDQAILNALELFDKLKEDGKVTDKKKQ